jgi:hypothetical protein
MLFFEDSLRPAGFFVLSEAVVDRRPRVFLVVIVSVVGRQLGDGAT